MLTKLRQKSVEELLLFGYLIRLIAVIYSILHDETVSHIKYTDIDYHVFTNGSIALVDGKSPYRDIEFRYSPLVALFFSPNTLNPHVGKFMLITADILCGHLQYRLNIYQGTHRLNSKLYLIIWLFNPLTIGISSRGSFEPIITLLILTSLYCLINNIYVLAGLVYGLSIHLKLYPIIYAVALYLYLIQKRPYLIVQSKLTYWLKTFSPNSSHLKFFISTGVSIVLSCYGSYSFYGKDYIEQSFIYHLRRKDLQHNFSAYFYLFKKFPNYQDELSVSAFSAQLIGISVITAIFSSFDTNRRIKLRKLTFSLFAVTFIFVSLNKVCTSQYFNWYLIFLPLILESLNLGACKLCLIILAWTSTQSVWLLFAYLYEYQGYNVIDYVGGSSFVFLVSNLLILFTLCYNFDARTTNKSYSN